MKSMLQLIGLILVNGLFMGCATEDTLGDKMIRKGESTEELGSQWNEGNELVREGEELMAQGHELRKEAQIKIAEGKRLIQEGEQLKRKSQRKYREKFPPAEIRLKSN